MLLEILIYREQRSLGIERVEDGLDHQDVSSAIQQAAYRFGIACHQFVERDVACTRVVYIRGDRGSAPGRP